MAMVQEMLGEELPALMGEELPANPFESAESKKKRTVEEIKALVAKYGGYFTEGLEHFIHNPHVACKEKLQRFYSDEGFDDILQYLEADDFCIGRPLDLEEGDYAALYAIANEAFEKDPQLALKLYTTLTCLNFTYPEFLIGMALASNRLGDHIETERFFKLALLINPDHPDPYFFFGNYLAAIKDPRAELLLEQAKIFSNKS